MYIVSFLEWDLSYFSPEELGARRPYPTKEIVFCEMLK